MGSFNQTPFLSHLPLTAGAPTVLIFLVPTGEGHVVYHTDNYKPVFLPVYGEYDDYGKIENVVRDFNVECIEKFFGKDIDTIIEEIDDRLVGRHEDEETAQSVANTKHAKLYAKMTFTLEHKDYWDAISENFKRTWYKEAHTTQYFLEDVLGLVADEKKGRDSRYKTEYAIPGLPEFKLASDGRWSHLINAETGKEVRPSELPNNPKQYGTYHPEQLAKVLTTATGEDWVSKVPERLRNLSIYGMMYNISAMQERKYVAKHGPREAKPEKTTEELTAQAARMADLMSGLKKDDDGPIDEVSRQDTIDRFLKHLEESGGTDDLFDFGSSSYKGEDGLTGRGGNDTMEGLIKSYKNLGVLFDERLEEAFLKFMDTNMALGWNSWAYALSGYCNQETHWDFQVSMAKVALTIAEKEKAERAAEEEGDDEDE